MLNNITTIKRSVADDYTFSILVPTWNNLEYLKLCLRSLSQHSRFNHQVIVMINEGTDGTLDWISSKTTLDYIHSKDNIGICYGLNLCRALVKASYLVYINDDMYMLSDWDLALSKEIQSIGHRNFFLSSTIIEPVKTGNNCVIVSNYGRNLEQFKEAELLKEYRAVRRPDWSGSTWPPSLVPLELWDAVGGLSTEFSPGMYSDPDFSKKLWDAGVRYFKGVSASRAYHFVSKSVSRISHNHGSTTFLLKWGMTAGTFKKYYLRSGSNFSGPLEEPVLKPAVKLRNYFKRVLLSGFGTAR